MGGSTPRIVVAALVAVAVAGCGRGAGLSEDQLHAVVLQRADLPETFVRFDYGPLTLADLQPGPRSDPQRFGRKDGWKARYRRPGSMQTRGPLVVQSIVDLFGSPDGAEQDLAAYRTEFARAARRVGSARLTPQAIGDGGYAFTFVQRTPLSRIRFFTLAWRDGTLTSSVSVNGFDDKIAFADALALAQKQQRRIEQARQ